MEPQEIIATCKFEGAVYGILQDGSYILLTPEWLDGWIEDEQASGN